MANHRERRLATPQDCRTIADFFVDIRKDTVPSVHSAHEVAEFIETHLLPRDSSYVIEQATGHKTAIVAWLDVYEGWVDQLYCRRGFTGQSLGCQLLSFAKSLSPKGLKLYTFQVNQGARRFYRREGFVEIELTEGAVNEERSPDVLLQWIPT